jgi:hypothetical protein
MYVHMPQVLSRNPFFWFEGQLERCYKWRDLSDASPSLPDLVLWGFLYFGESVFGGSLSTPMHFLPLSQSRVCESLEEFTVHGLQNYSNKSI